MAVANQIANTTGDFKSILGTTNDITRGFSGIVKKIRSMNGDEMTPAQIRDYYTNGFLSQKSNFTPEFFARMFDEPTYLSFKIEFLFDDAANDKRNIAYNSNGLMGRTSPYYGVMYDYMPEPFLESYSNVLSENTAIGTRYSAEKYLDKNLGDHGRASMLHNFKAALNDIQKNFPFYFTSISGISSLTKLNPGSGIRLKDCVLTLDCMEGLDLKITQLLQLYRKIVWDDVYQRWVLPDMMRYFGMRIYISEIRLFGSVKSEKDKHPFTYDFSDPNVRNMTYRMSEKNLFNKIGDVLGQANVVSQTFLGTKSNISKALDYTTTAMNTINEGVSDIKGAFNQIQYCNNAINEVMPTICFECHMCEFDLQDTMSYMDSLKSSNKNSEAVAPKLKIKVGQVSEKQVYPLNSSLKTVGEDYPKYTKRVADYKYDTTDDPYNDRDNKLKFLGNYLSDETLVRRYQSPDLSSRVKEYINSLSHDMGDVAAQNISVRRLNDHTINKYNDMVYRTDDLPDMIATQSLVTTGLNEALAIGRMAGVDSNIIGTQSLATDQTDTIKNNMDLTKAKLNNTTDYTDTAESSKNTMSNIGKALQGEADNMDERKNSANEQLQQIAESMMGAADMFYNGSEAQSMAADGMTREQINQFASESFESYIKNLENSTAADNKVMKEFLDNYRKVQSESEYKSTATNSTFSKLNG